MKLDQKDKIILESLMRNCRVSLKELSRRTNLTHSAVLYRIRKYEKEGLVLKYDGLLNFNKCEGEFVFMFVNDLFCCGRGDIYFEVSGFVVLLIPGFFFP